jgi:hypothetical protein
VAVGPASFWLVLAGALVVRGIGLGAVTIPVMIGAYEGLPREAVPHASIITRTAQQVGGSFGTAVLAVILERQLAAHAADPAVAFDHTFWWATGFTAAAVALALALPTKTIRRTATAP